MTDKNQIYRTDDRHNDRSNVYKLPDRDLQEKIPVAPVYSEINVDMLGDRFLFQEFPQTTMMGTLHVPSIGDVGINKARVVAIGNDVKKLKVGDIVFKVAGLGETLITNIGPFRFLPENGAIAIDRVFNGTATPIMQDSQVGG